MRYKPFYMPGPYDEEDSPWFDSEDKAWDWVFAKGCRITGDTVEPCEMCQAEWDVVSEEELKEIMRDE